MTDEELALLEQVTYIDKNVYEAAGLKWEDRVKNKATVSDILEKFDDAALERLRNNPNDNIDGAWTGASEWADIIEAMKKNPDIKDLTVSDSYKTPDGETTLGICFKDPKEKGKGYVAFKGTSGYDEWNDNVQGIVQSDTKCQQAAADFVKGIDKSIEDITVVGHSKGANKAMYVTVTDESGRIKHCVAMDGQGFSNKFMAKYASEIMNNGGKITNYSITTDFVHVLMKQIPNSKQIYCEGYGMANAGQYHSPASFFVQDKNGKILFDNNGSGKFTAGVPEDENVKIIHRFVEYVMDTSSDYELQIIADYLGPIAGNALGSHSFEMDQLLENPTALALIVEKLSAFSQKYNYNMYDLTNTILTFVFPEKNQRVIVLKILTLVILMSRPDWLIESSSRNVLQDVLDIFKQAGLFFSLELLSIIPSILESIRKYVLNLLAAIYYVGKFISESHVQVDSSFIYKYGPMILETIVLPGAFTNMINMKYASTNILAGLTGGDAQTGEETSAATSTVQAPSVMHDYTEEFRKDVFDVFNTIHAQEFYSYSRMLAPLFDTGVRLNIDIDNEMNEIYSVYNATEAEDNTMLEILRGMFMTANDEDGKYSNIVSTDISNIVEVRNNFLASFATC
ncbi:MAG: DUF2974 domain-containing protein [Butyrivibrio sp.]|nr:DUF2974 domain-containing protein [Butyrivibrio sp.]